MSGSTKGEKSSTFNFEAKLIGVGDWFFNARTNENVGYPSRMQSLGDVNVREVDEKSNTNLFCVSVPDNMLISEISVNKCAKIS